MNELQANMPSVAPSGAVASAARHGGNGAAQATQDVAGQVGRAAREWWLQHKYNARFAIAGVRDRSQDLVRAQPFKSVLAAAGVGALIAAVCILATRRGRS